VRRPAGASALSYRARPQQPRAHLQPAPHFRNSAYIQARQRLPQERLGKALHTTAQAADRRAGSGGQLNGRPVKVADASSAQAADTPPNQKRYPQSPVQKPGCGFPILKFMVLFSLCSGAILNVMLGNLHDHDLRLLHGLWAALKSGDILLGDRAFGEFTCLAGLPRLLGVDVVARLHQRRKADFRKAQRLAKGEGLFVWTKGWACSEVLTAKQWQRLPAQIMEQLRCQTPDMAEKELLAYLVAHNLIRCVIAQAIASYNVDLERVSFKGSVDALRQYSKAISQARNRSLRDQLWQDLLRNLALDLVPYRPGRLEPRALKRRPKNFGWLTQPRRKCKEVLHRNRHWKSNPRDLRRLN
jgi:hypothetical protein